jgi:DNA topoisomerase-1
MARSLVIVESPAKAKTINKYLGRNFSVKASYGHVMDLPKKTIGILLPGQENGKKKKKRAKGKGKSKAAEKPEKKIVVTAENIFDPEYVVIPDKEKIIDQLKSAADSAENVYLATDPDREGEAISAHLLNALATNKAQRAKFSRVMFNEITQKAIRAAFEKPTKVDENLVDAQQARRVLDRIVGYKVSPLLWDKVRRGLSAGRVQTVAVRLIVEREREIRAFIPKEYWTIHALLAAGEPPAFEAKLTKYKGEDLEIPNEAEAQRILAEIERDAEGKAPLRAASVYDFQVAAGLLQPAPLHSKADDDARAAIV